jgi:hypothetical protein
MALKAHMMREKKMMIKQVPRHHGPRFYNYEKKTMMMTS